MCDVILDLFSNFFLPHHLFKPWLSLLLNMQNNKNNYEEAEREERKKNEKIIFNSKKEFGKESFIHNICKIV